MTDVLLGRQPVLDRDERLFGYELLCRSEGESTAGALDGDRMTATVVLNAFVELGVDAASDAGPSFVRMTPRFLCEGLYRPLPASRVVLTLGVERDPTPEVFEALRVARMRGYRTALDRVDGRAALAPVLRFVEFARIDVAALGEDAAIGLGPALRSAGVTPVATKVETPESFRACRRHGYALFQGFHFCRPDVLRTRRVPAHRAPIVELLAKIRDPNVDLRGLTRIIEQNPALSVHILRMVKATGGAASQSIGSIRHAVQRLGLERVRNGLSLLALADADDDPSALTTTALVRARTGQLLARRVGSPREEAFFTVGLLSILDAVFGLPIEEALALVPLSPEIRDAILAHEGLAGLALEAALSCEEGRAARQESFDAFGFRAIRESHLEALRWARDVSQTEA